MTTITIIATTQAAIIPTIFFLLVPLASCFVVSGRPHSGQNRISSLTSVPQSGQNGMASPPTYVISTTSRGVFIPFSFLSFKHIVLESVRRVNSPLSSFESHEADAVTSHQYWDAQRYNQQFLLPLSTRREFPLCNACFLQILRPGPLPVTQIASSGKAIYVP